MSNFFTEEYTVKVCSLMSTTSRAKVVDHDFLLEKNVFGLKFLMSKFPHEKFDPSEPLISIFCSTDLKLWF